MKSFLRVCFPPICIHCEEEAERFICRGCAAAFELIDPYTRCPYCFAEQEGHQPCPVCVQKKRWQMRVASAVDYLPAVKTFVQRLKYGGMPYLARTAASFMFLQFQRLQWQLPDLIVPVPRRLWFQGTNHALLLAEAFSQLSGVAVEPVVKRQIGDLARAKLSQIQREQMSEATFYLRKQVNLEGKRVLIIDDVLTTGTTLRQTAEALKDGFPKKLYALTFARTQIK